MDASTQQNGDPSSSPQHMSTDAEFLPIHEMERKFLQGGIQQEGTIRHLQKKIQENEKQLSKLRGEVRDGQMKQEESSELYYAAKSKRSHVAELLSEITKQYTDLSRDLADLELRRRNVKQALKDIESLSSPYNYKQYHMSDHVMKDINNALSASKQINEKGILALTKKDEVQALFFKQAASIASQSLHFQADLQRALEEALRSKYMAEQAAQDVIKSSEELAIAIEQNAETEKEHEFAQESLDAAMTRGALQAAKLENVHNQYSAFIEKKGILQESVRLKEETQSLTKQITDKKMSIDESKNDLMDKINQLKESNKNVEKLISTAKDEIEEKSEIKIIQEQLMEQFRVLQSEIKVGESLGGIQKNMDELDLVLDSARKKLDELQQEEKSYVDQETEINAGFELGKQIVETFLSKEKELVAEIEATQKSIRKLQAESDEMSLEMNKSMLPENVIEELQDQVRGEAKLKEFIEYLQEFKATSSADAEEERRSVVEKEVAYRAELNRLTVELDLLVEEAAENDKFELELMESNQQLLGLKETKIKNRTQQLQEIKDIQEKIAAATNANIRFAFDLNNDKYIAVNTRAATPPPKVPPQVVDISSSPEVLFDNQKGQRNVLQDIKFQAKGHRQKKSNHHKKSNVSRQEGRKLHTPPKSPKPQN